MKKLIQDVQVEQENWFQDTVNTSVSRIKRLLGVASEEAKDWLKDAFKGLGLTGWWSSMVKDILYVLFVILFTILVLGVFKKIIISNIQKGLLNINQVIVSETTASSLWPTHQPWFRNLYPNSEHLSQMEFTSS